MMRGARSDGSGSARAALPALTRRLVRGGMVVAWAWTAVLTPLPARGAATVPAQLQDPLPSILVDVSTTTWKPRGRILFDVTATVRNKLSRVGFPVVRDAAAPHDLTLTLDYGEERGRQYDLTTYQTIVTGHFRLEGRDSTPLLDFTVQERSGDQLGGTPPYIDAIQRFETNPSIFFLGDLVLARLRGEEARAPALVAGLRRELGGETSGIDPLSAPHTMMMGESHLPRLAHRRAIRELGRLGGAAAVPFLRDLLSHDDPTIQHAARRALAKTESQETVEQAPTP